jgi:hypothetical protein
VYGRLCLDALAVERDFRTYCIHVHQDKGKRRLLKGKQRGNKGIQESEKELGGIYGK